MTTEGLNRFIPPFIADEGVAASDGFVQRRCHFSVCNVHKCSVLGHKKQLIERNTAFFIVILHAAKHHTTNYHE